MGLTRACRLGALAVLLMAASALAQTELTEIPAAATPAAADTAPTAASAAATIETSATAQTDPIQTLSASPEEDQHAPMDKARMLAAQNAWRKRVGARPLEWSEEAEAVAAYWAESLTQEQCGMRHNPELTRRKIFGENIYTYWFSRPYLGYRRDEGDVADAWGVEIKHYDEATNTCSAPHGETCGHYTQMVWARSLKVGCARAKCESAELWICNYFPRGNMVGVHPYRGVVSNPAGITAPSAPAPAFPASPVPPLTGSGESVSSPPPGPDR